MESILTSIKKLVGIDELDEHFDPDVIMCINTAFSTLNQVGAGPITGFSITNEHEVWSDILGVSTVLLGFIKTYIYLKAKLVFDPPQNSAMLESINKMIGEAEWRIQVEADLPYVPVSNPDNNDENWADGW